VKITNLRQVVEYQLCCGCGLCAYLCPEYIRMADAPAFGRRPLFAEDIKTPESVQLGLRLCPGTGLSHTQETLRRKEIIGSLAGQWGPVLDAWEGYAADPEIRFKGSSGGALSAISLYCLEHEGMHGVLHTTADEQLPFLNQTSMSRDREALLAAAGSRYSPASPCEGLREIENAPTPCVFIGKPCDVAATQNARQHRPALHAKVGLTMACFCAGTPSTQGTMEMLRQMGVDCPEKLLSLRYRGQGWPGKTVAVYRGESESLQADFTYEQSWGDILQKYRQWRCYICPDHTGEFADIATGDPWYKPTEEGGHGQSLILARTEAGRRIIEKAISAGYLIAEKVDPGLLPASQPNLLKTRARLWGQLLALRLLRAPAPSYRGFNLFSAWWHNLTFREKMLSVPATMKRIYLKRIKQRMNMVYGKY
jgi:coenzyme F420 hydrogenase subunit beta